MGIRSTYDAMFVNGIVRKKNEKPYETAVYDFPIRQMTRGYVAYLLCQECYENSAKSH